MKEEKKMKISMSINLTLGVCVFFISIATMNAILLAHCYIYFFGSPLYLPQPLSSHLFIDKPGFPFQSVLPLPPSLSVSGRERILLTGDPQPQYRFWDHELRYAS